MVVLAVSVLSKSGKTLVSRQYADMTRETIEGYLREFLHLVKVKPGKEHTYFETDDMRYVYLTIESLYLLIVTNRQSNIIEDMKTLELLRKLVSENNSSSLDEKGICDSAFDLIFAFDDVINSMGYREDVNFQQVLNNLDMKSSNEISHILKTRMKVSKSKEVMKQKAKEIDNKKLKDSLTEASSAIKDALDPSASTKALLNAGNSPAPITQGSEPSFQATDPCSPLESSSSKRKSN